MIFFIFLISIYRSQSTNFMISGLSTNMSFVYVTENNCNYFSCQSIICDILHNTTSAYIVLSPIKKITSCPKIPFNFNVNMISFVFNQKGQMLSPNICNTIGDCITKACNSYLSSKESFLMAFTGQCLL